MMPFLSFWSLILKANENYVCYVLVNYFQVSKCSTTNISVNNRVKASARFSEDRNGGPETWVQTPEITDFQPKFQAQLPYRRELTELVLFLISVFVEVLFKIPGLTSQQLPLVIFKSSFCLIELGHHQMDKIICINP